MSTFLDSDESVQYIDINPATGPCPDTGCAILVGMHGSGVEATVSLFCCAIY